MNMIKNVFALNEIQILKSLGKSEEELILPDLVDYLGNEELGIVNDKHSQEFIEDKAIRARWRR